MMQRTLVLAAAASLIALAVVTPAPSSRAAGRLVVPPNGTFTKECGACHVAYPPRLLPARSWRTIMGRLDAHFGTDASVDAKTAADLTAFLVEYGGRDRGVTATNRITDTAWFRRKHREVPVATWTHTAVKSPANCAACHRAADRGNFDEHAVRMPR